MTNLIIKERFQVTPNADETDTFYIHDRYTEAPWIPDSMTYVEARVLCNEMNENHHRLVKWSVKNAVVSLQLELTFE